MLSLAGEPPEMDNEEEYEDEEEDLSKDPEEDTYKFIKLLIQSLQQLGRLDETIEVGWWPGCVSQYRIMLLISLLPCQYFITLKVLCYWNTK